MYRDEIAELPDIPAGSCVRVETDYGYDFGVAFFHPSSQIAARLLRHNREPDAEFFTERFRYALELRQRLFPKSNAYRLVFGESDFLPGLIVDRYGDYCAIQTLSAGMERFFPEIVQGLRTILPSARGIIAKNDSRIRLLEGLPLEEHVAWGEIPEIVEFEENGVRLLVSLREGQKTGYFFDQRLNRITVQSLSKGLRVLDCFCNQGGFALNAALGGAEHARGIDSSIHAIEACKRNANANGLEDRTSWIQADVFSALKEYAAAGDRWDMVILDPPAFAKSKHSVKQALRGYAEINRQSLKLIAQGGYLVSASCSHHVSEEALRDVVLVESQRINRKLQTIFVGSQSPDHPVLPSMPESRYLKFFVFRVF